MTDARALPLEIRDSLLALASSAVRYRFSITPHDFVNYVAARARGVTDPARLPEHVCRLSLDDLYLACACTQKDEAAWRECEARFFSYVRGFARRFLDAAAAADVADQVIADLWGRQLLASYDGRSALKTWLGAVVSNAAVNAGKVRRRTVSLEPAAVRRQWLARWREQPAASPEVLDAERAFAGLVRRSFERLNRDQKLLLLMYYEQGLTLAEMERVLGASKATLSRRLDSVRREVSLSVDALALQELRLAPHALRERIDLSRVEIDLATVLGMQKHDGAVV
jgi:RNA polymerase sigma factor (sigma-70 family)